MALIGRGCAAPHHALCPPKSVDQLDLQALHRVRSRLVSQRTAIVNQIRAFLIERGIAVRQGLRFLRQSLPDLLANRADMLTPRMLNMIKDLASDLHHLDQIQSWKPRVRPSLSSPPRCLGVYGDAFMSRIRAMGIRDRPTAARSPWQNGYCERAIGSIRRDCLDHVIVLGSATFSICCAVMRATTIGAEHTCP